MERTNKKANEIIVDEFRGTITVGPSFYKKACVYGSKEYKKLASAKKENRDFVVVVKVRKSTSRKGLTLAFMQSYMEDQRIIDENCGEYVLFEEMVKGLKHDANKTPHISFAQLTSWFVKTYPNYADYSPIDAITKRLGKSA